MKKIEINSSPMPETKENFSLPTTPNEMCVTAELNIISPFCLYADKHGKRFFKSANGYYLLDHSVKSTEVPLENGAQATVKPVTAITPNYTRSYFFVEKTGDDKMNREVKILKAIKNNVNLDFPFHLIQNIQYSQTEGVKTRYYSRYEKGGDLQRHQVYIHEQCKLKNDTALSYVFNVLCQLVEGLNALHNGKFLDEEGKTHFGIVHNDLKPANVFVRISGDVVIGDFGCAYYADSIAPQYSTLSFTAPELFSDLTAFCKLSTKNADKADIFSLGVLLNLLILGKLPEKKVNEYIISCQIPGGLDTQFKFRKWAEVYETQAQIQKMLEAKQYLQDLMVRNPFISADVQVRLLKSFALIMQFPVTQRPTSKELKEYLRKLSSYFGTFEERAEKSKAFVLNMFASPPLEDASKTFYLA